MTKAVYIIIFIALTFFCHGQTFPWVQSTTSPTNAAGEGWAVSRDGTNNVFATGYFTGSITFGTYTVNNVGNLNMFLAKYNSSGAIQWAKSAGSTGTDIARSVSADAAGNVYITGIFSSPTIAFGTTTLTNAGANNIFICKYDANGNELWAKSAGGVNDQAYGVSTDAGGDVIITGGFYSASIAFGTATLTNVVGTGTGNVFVVKYDANGNVLWARNAGGSGGNTLGISVSTDLSGNVFVTGQFNCSAVAFGTTTLTSPGGTAVFLVKYDTNGNMVWAKSAGGFSQDGSYSISADTGGNSYITGTFGSPSMVFGTYTLTNTGTKNAFITKYDSNGNVLWAKSTVGPGTQIGYSVSSYTGGVFVTGSFTNTIAFGTNTLTPPPISPDPMFIALYDLNGNIICTEVLASGGDDNNAICADGLGNAYIVGDFLSNPFVIGSYTFTPSGYEDFFIAKFNCQPSSTGITNVYKNSNSNIFPNPTENSFTLQVDTEIENGEVVLINMIGQKVYAKKISGGKNNIIIQDLPKGLYNYIILSTNKQINGGKLMID